MESIIEKLRNIIQDNLKDDGYYCETYYTDNVFTLPDANVSPSTLKVYVNGELKDSTNYSFDAVRSKITYTGDLTEGDVLSATYSYYEKYSDSELKSYIKSAVSKISVEKYKTFKVGDSDTFFPTPTEEEKNLIAVVASILIGDSISYYRTPEFTVRFNETQSKDEKIKMIIRNFIRTFGIMKYVDLKSETNDDSN